MADVRPSARRRPASAAFIAGLVGLVAALCAGLVLAVPAAADITDWEATPTRASHHDGGANGSDAFTDVAIARGGVIWACGYGHAAPGDQDGLLVRQSVDPWQAQKALYGGALHGSDGFTCLALGPGGVVYTAGFTTSKNSQDWLLVKWSAGGRRLWVRRLDGPLHGSDRAVDVAVDRDGNMVVCGTCRTAGGLDWTVASWRPDGRRRWLWRLTSPGSGDERPAALLVDAAGTTFVAGEARAAGDLPALGLVRLDRGGRPLWRRLWTGPGGGGARAYGMARMPDGDIVVAGEAAAESGYDALVAAYTPAGRRDWHRTVPISGGGWNGRLLSVAVTKGMVLEAVGQRYQDFDSDPLVYRVELAGGSSSWGIDITPVPDTWRAVVVDPWDGLVAVGSLRSSTVTSSTAWRVSRSSTTSGGLFWGYLSTPTAGGAPDSALAVATRGNVVAVAGQARYPETMDDATLMMWRY